MRPLSLQGEKQMYLGYVLPTLLSILQNENQFCNLRFCHIIRDAIVNGVKSRFQHILDFENISSRVFIYLCNNFFTNV
jgi:hypothetical protein